MSDANLRRLPHADALLDLAPFLLPERSAGEFVWASRRLALGKFVASRQRFGRAAKDCDGVAASTSPPMGRARQLSTVRCGIERHSSQCSPRSALWVANVDAAGRRKLWGSNPQFVREVALASRKWTCPLFFPMDSLHGHDLGCAAAGTALDGHAVTDGHAFAVGPGFRDSA